MSNETSTDQQKEQRRAEIIENRKTFQRLNRDIIEGARKTETLTVTCRDSTQYEITIHALTELAIGHAVFNAGLEWTDLTKPQTPADFKLADKGLAKARLLDEVIAAALTGSEKERLTPDELAEMLPAPERARVFKRVLEMSGLSAKTVENVEKFPAEPTR